jgi:hypothetical protein
MHGELSGSTPSPVSRRRGIFETAHATNVHRLHLTAFHIETENTNVEGGGKITHGLRGGMEERSG